MGTYGVAFVDANSRSSIAFGLYPDILPPPLVAVVRLLRRDFIPTSILPRENLHMCDYFRTFALDFGYRYG